MREILRKALSILLFPPRIFGYATDIWFLWSKKDWVLVVGMPLLASAVASAYAAAQQYPWPSVVMFTVGMLLIGFWAIAVAIEKWRHYRAKQHATAQEPHAPQPALSERPYRSRGVVAEDWAKYHDRGSTFYDSLDEDIHLSGDAEASTEGPEFGRRQEPETEPEPKPDEDEPEPGEDEEVN